MWLLECPILLGTRSLQGQSWSSSKDTAERATIDVCSAAWDTHKKYLDNPALPEQVFLKFTLQAGGTVMFWEIISSSLWIFPRKSQLMLYVQSVFRNVYGEADSHQMGWKSKGKGCINRTPGFGSEAGYFKCSKGQRLRTPVHAGFSL